MINIHFHNNRHLAHYAIIFAIFLRNFSSLHLFLYDKVHLKAYQIQTGLLLTMDDWDLDNTVLIFYI